MRFWRSADSVGAVGAVGRCMRVEWSAAEWVVVVGRRWYARNAAGAEGKESATCTGMRLRFTSAHIAVSRRSGSALGQRRCAGSAMRNGVQCVISVVEGVNSERIHRTGGCAGGGIVGCAESREQRSCGRRREWECRCGCRSYGRHVASCPRLRCM
jgi:hypothetical protein